MQNETRYFSKAEKVSAECREIYSGYGYKQYNMSRFEEYDLYAANRDFLIGDSIITFTERGGRLMALKPDVTLSIVKNAACEGGRQEKVFYLESVYRTDQSSSEFREIMQLGLECIGDIGLYQTGEVVALAAMSLSVISKNYILDLSHRGFISALADRAAIYGEARGELMRCIGGRNSAGVRSICAARGVAPDLTEQLAGLTGLYGSMTDIMPKLELMSVGEKADAALAELRSIYRILEEFGCAERVNLDLSHTGDMKYYGGVTFCGYIENIPFALLSGGRYDGLLEKFDKPGGAVGFAIYLDRLSSLPEPKSQYDVDILLVTQECDGAEVARAVEKLRRSGRSVMAVRKISKGGPRCREIVYIEKMKDSDGEVSGRKGYR